MDQIPVTSPPGDTFAFPNSQQQRDPPTTIEVAIGAPEKERRFKKNLPANELRFDLRPSKTKLGLNTEVPPSISFHAFIQTTDGSRAGQGGNSDKQHPTCPWSLQTNRGYRHKQAHRKSLTYGCQLSGAREKETMDALF